jgi:hypothetical protein
VSTLAMMVSWCALTTSDDVGVLRLDDRASVWFYTTVLSAFSLSSGVVAVAEEGDSVDTGAVGVGTLSFLDLSAMLISSFL